MRLNVRSILWRTGLGQRFFEQKQEEMEKATPDSAEALDDNTAEPMDDATAFCLLQQATAAPTDGAMTTVGPL